MLIQFFSRLVEKGECTTTLLGICIQTKLVSQNVECGCMNLHFYNFLQHMNKEARNSSKNDLLPVDVQQNFVKNAA